MDVKNILTTCFLPAGRGWMVLWWLMILSGCQGVYSDSEVGPVKVTSRKTSASLVDSDSENRVILPGAGATSIFSRQPDPIVKRKSSIVLAPIESIGMAQGEENSGSDPEFDVMIDTRGLRLEEFFTRIAQDVMGLSLFIDQRVDLSAPGPTVAIQGPVRRSELSELVLRTARSNGVFAEFVDGSLIILPEATGSSSVRIGVGASHSDVPVESDDILQIVPLKNDWSIEVDRLVSEISGVSLTRSNNRNAYVLRGRRQSVLKSLDIIEALDTPAVVGSSIRLVPLSFMSPGEAAAEVQKLLSSEGVKSLVVRGSENNLSSSILLLPMDRLSGLLVFSSDPDLISRVEYWLSLVDIPSESAERDFFTFRPKRISAEDLLRSFSQIFTNRDPATSGGQQGVSGDSTLQAPEGVSQSRAVVTDDFRMIADLNSGQLVINSSELVFKNLVDVLSKLDISPRQVLLEVLIAEVSLKDEFRFGFEWALNNRGVNYSTVGAFGANSFSGLAINLSKDKILSGKVFSSDNLIKVLSSPTLLVKEGQQASVSVGSQISVVGQTTFDPLVGGQRQTTAAEYLSTGVSVSFEASLIGSDVIDLSIEQKISNTVAGSAGAAGNPDVFNRELRTEVLAQSGQTVLLGGLISERNSFDRGGVPFLNKIPILGGAFGSQGKQSDRTELVMLVTPRVLEDPSGWADIYEDFRKKLSSIGEIDQLVDQVESKVED